MCNFLCFISVSCRGVCIPLQPTLRQSLDASKAPSYCQHSQTQAQTEGPRRPLQWKADGRTSDGSLLQSAVQERKLLIRRHPSSGLERGRRGGGKTEQRLTSSVWSLSNAFSWHIHGSHSYTHTRTHVKTHAYA